MKGRNGKKKIAVLLSVVLLLTPVFVYLPPGMFHSYGFGLVFISSGQAGHPYLKGKVPGEENDTYFLCMNKGASAHSNYDYSKINADIDYSQGSIEQKRMFWAYIGAFGSYDGNVNLTTHFGDRQVIPETGREVAWSKGKSNGGSEWIENMANDGFMSLENTPEGCKNPKDILDLISKYNTVEQAMYINDLRSGPGQIDREKLYELTGLKDWETFVKYCRIDPVTPGLVINTEGQNLTWSFPDLPSDQKPKEAVMKISYDPTIFRVMEVTGRLEYFQCDVPGSQQLYRAKGSVNEKTCEFFLTTKYKDTPSTPTSTHEDQGEVSLKIYQHNETFQSHYKVDLKKMDHETGNCLQGSTWQVLERFDDSQLSNDETDGGIIEDNMREAPVSWKDFLVFDDDLVTDNHGYLSHEDIRYYDFCHGYCNGHPLPQQPEIEEIEEPEGEEREEGDQEIEEYERLMEEWQDEVDSCEAYAQDSGGTFHHWLCDSEEEPSEKEAFKKSGCKEARDITYENFIHLEYDYTFRETKPRDGYILHDGHPDDVPVEIITTASSEAKKPKKLNQSSNRDIKVGGYVRNMIKENSYEDRKREEAFQGEEDSQPEVEKGPSDQTAHTFEVYDHRVSGQIHFNKKDMDLNPGETQGDSTLEGAIYGLFAADAIYAPDTLRDENGNVISGSGIIFDANDLVAVASTDKHGDGSFLSITERPHSIYNYEAGEIEYTGKSYPKNLYVKNGEDNETVHGDCWIGRPLFLGNYYIKELSRSEGYELSITGKDMEFTNADENTRKAYGDTDDAKTHPLGSAWVLKQLYHGVTFPEGNSAYGNKENLLLLETRSKDAIHGYNVVLDGIPKGAEIYLNNVKLNPVVISQADGGEWVDAKEEPLYQMAESNAVYKRDINGDMIEKPGVTSTIKIPYEAVGTEAKELLEEGEFVAEDPSRFSNLFTDSKSNIRYIKAELEYMMRESLSMETPKDEDYSSFENPVYDKKQIVNGKTIYGKPEIVLEIDNVTTNQSVIEAILNYYMEERVFTYGGLQKLQYSDGKVFATVVVGMESEKPLLYKTDDEGEIVSAYLTKLNKAYGRYVIRKYTKSEVNVSKVIDTGESILQVTPDFEVNEDGILTDKTMYPTDSERYLSYATGETLYDYWYLKDGDYVGHAPITRKVWQPNYKEVTVHEESVNASKILQVDSMEEVVDQEGSTYYYYNEESKQYTIHVGSKDMDLTGVKTGSFTIVLNNGKTVVTNEDINRIGSNNVWGYEVGDSILNGEYTIHVSGAGAGAFTSSDFDSQKTFIKNQRLIYNGYHNLIEDGNTIEIPVFVEERIISQKIKVTKAIDKKSYHEANTYGEIHEDWFTRMFGGYFGRSNLAGKMDNFRFKVYLKSNLESLYRDREGDIPLLETISFQGDEAVYNYEKFFDALHVANEDKWDGNVSDLDHVRQFAITWYLEDEVETLAKSIESQTHSNEIYDKALEEAMKKAEAYLKPFFDHDLDSLYSIEWDSAIDGGSDRDFTTLSADTLYGDVSGNSDGYYFATSQYLPYGTYVVVEQQPKEAKLGDLKNKHYEIDKPREVSIPSVYEDYKGSQSVPEVMNHYYNYSSHITSSEMKSKYKIYFDKDHVNVREGVYAPVLVPWTVMASYNSATEVADATLLDDGESSYKGFGYAKFTNQFYHTRLGIEKLDLDTGENVLHDGAIFALYAASREDGENTDGKVKFYEKDTMIEGSREFLEGMGASNITQSKDGWKGVVPRGTPICKESEQIILKDLEAFTTTRDGQNTGYLVTPQPLGAGTYVLCEIKPPAGYVRTKPVAIEIYSDRTTYYLDGNREEQVAAAIYESQDTARLYVSNTPVRLEVSKVKDSAQTVTYKTETRVEGTEVALNERYGAENLEFAYKNGTYLGYGWFKGTLETLLARKEAGEEVELVYFNGVFAGYGLISRPLDTATHKNRFVSGAKMTLYDAIEIKRNGDSGDYGYDGVEVIRDRNNNVQSIKVKKGYAGATIEFIKKEEPEETWTYERIEREDSDILFYSLADLMVTEENGDGGVYGYDRDGNHVSVKNRESIYVLKGGKLVFELTGGDLTKVQYIKEDQYLTLPEETTLYHLDSEGNRDAYVDPITGMAFAMDGEKILVWPVTLWKSKTGAIIGREKIKTFRIGSINADTHEEYTIGTYQEETFQKSMTPVLNSYGLPEYYDKSEESYKKGTPIYDIDGDYVGYKYDDLLDAYNQASYKINDKSKLYSDGKLYHRQGEAFIMENTWMTGESYPNDPFLLEDTTGQADMLKRILPGTYIMEEVEAPSGYEKGFPKGVTVKETVDVQTVSMEDCKIKVEISKTDGASQYKIPVISDYDLESDGQRSLTVIEPKGSYTYEQIKGAHLRLYKAERVYTTDSKRYPKGYYLVKSENTPAKWSVEDSTDNTMVMVTADWVTDGTPKYFEGIPAGDYILEEMEAASGYIRNSMEITIDPMGDVQTINLTNDHTKLEIYKYYLDAKGEKSLLPNDHAAGLALYEAKTDQDGKVLMEDGKPQYHKTKKVGEWMTDDLRQYTEITEKSTKLFARIKSFLGISNNKSSFLTDFEATYEEKGEEFTYLTWYTKDGARSANRKESISTEKGERVTQVWETDTGSVIRITIYRNVRNGALDNLGQLPLIFEYQFNYKENNGIKSYDTLEGIHRLDYLPLYEEQNGKRVGHYVLVEETVPEGFKAANPKVITIIETEAVQRFGLQNEEKAIDALKVGTLEIYKKATDTKQGLENARFKVTNQDTKDIWYMTTGKTGRAILKDLPVGETQIDGTIKFYTYNVEEISPPDFYQISSEVKEFQFDRFQDGQEVKYYYEVSNEPTKIHIRKTDFNNGMAVKGAKIAVYEAVLVDGTYQRYGDAIATVVSGEQGFTLNKKLKANHIYMIEELKAPAGYVLSDPVAFTVNKAGTGIQNISNAFNVLKLISKNGAIEALTVTGRVPVKVYTILKDLDNENEFLAFIGMEDVIEGNLYEITEYTEYSDGRTEKSFKETRRIYFDENGEYTLPSRTYLETRQELTDENGNILESWVVDPDNLDHTILISGKRYSITEYTIYDDTSSRISGIYRFSINDLGVIDNIDMEDRPVALNFLKIDKDTGERIAGGHYSLIDGISGNTLYEFDIREKASVKIPSYLIKPGHSYIFKEDMAPEGYSYEKEIHFTKDTSGISETIVMEDRKTKVKIHKIDSDGNFLMGAILRITDKKGEIVIPDFTTEGKETVIEGKLKAGETYILVEVKAPKGYEQSDPVRFYVPERDEEVDVFMTDLKSPPMPSSPTMPEEPEIPEVPLKAGRVTAFYKREPFMPTWPELIYGKKGKKRGEKTGDDHAILLGSIGFFVGIAGLVITLKKRKKG